jgi:hypothetical protein
MAGERMKIKGLLFKTGERKKREEKKKDRKNIGCRRYTGTTLMRTHVTLSLT